jgi:hypothetical protein
MNKDDVLSSINSKAVFAAEKNVLGSFLLAPETINDFSLSHDMDLCMSCDIHGYVMSAILDYHYCIGIRPLPSSTEDFLNLIVEDYGDKTNVTYDYLISLMKGVEVGLKKEVIEAYLNVFEGRYILREIVKLADLVSDQTVGRDLIESDAPLNKISTTSKYHEMTLEQKISCAMFNHGKFVKSLNLEGLRSATMENVSFCGINYHHNSIILYYDCDPQMLALFRGKKEEIEKIMTEFFGIKTLIALSKTEFETPAIFNGAI